jgi:DNA polymerase
MKKLWLDYETYWSDDYTLKKMTPIEYINDPRFEALGCGFIDERNNRMWVDGPDLPMFLPRIDWPNTFAISHNALFDMLVLAARFGVVPAKYGCTLSMANNWLSHRLKSVSLAALAQHYGLPPKMDTVHKTKNVNYHMLRQMPWLYDEVRTYAIDDAFKCRTIFTNMIDEGFPEGELEVVDMVIRMATQPKFELDQFVLAEYLAKVQAQKQALLDEAMIDKDNVTSIMSDTQLAGKLMHLVNPVPTKISKKTGKLTFAFAKTDKAFTDLLEHDDPFVQALVAARLGVKSTIEETRTERLLAISNVVDLMPVPLKYSGAHTHRFSGDWKINLQNLLRGGELRRSLRAPKGKKVVAIDASQIEARLNATLSGEEQLVEAFREGRDVYAEFAFDIYGYEIDRSDERFEIEGFVGKTAVLSLGYGSSPPTFQNMCRNKSEGRVKLTDMDGIRIVGLYRQRYKRIVQNWNYAQKTIIPMLMGANEGSMQQLQSLRDQPEGDWNVWGPVRILHNAIELPNGNRLRYRDLKYEVYDGRPGWSFMRGVRPHSLYGAKVVENVIQALAFIHIMETAIRVKHLTNGLLMPVHQVHDELVYIEDDSIAEMVKRLVVREMSRPPSWMPQAPLAAKGHIGQTYLDAK